MKDSIEHSCAECGIGGYSPPGDVPHGWTEFSLRGPAIGLDRALCSTECLTQYCRRTFRVIGEIGAVFTAPGTSAPIATGEDSSTDALEELISAAIRFGACSDSELLRFEQALNRARAKVGLLAGGPDR